MTLKRLYSELSKIIDEESKTTPDVLDKPIALCIMPWNTNANVLNRSSICGAASVINNEDVITITNCYN